MLENGSRIVSLPGTEGTIRSYSAVRLLLVDEASRVDDDTIAAVRPMLAVSGGQLIALSDARGPSWMVVRGVGGRRQRLQARARAGE